MIPIKIDWYHRFDWQGDPVIKMDSEAFWPEHEQKLVYKTKERLPDSNETREAIMAFDFEQELIWRQLPDGTTEYVEKMAAYRHWRPHYDAYMKQLKVFKDLTYKHKGLRSKKPAAPKRTRFPFISNPL